MLRKTTLLTIGLAILTIQAQKPAPNAQLQNYADALYQELARKRTALLDAYVPNKVTQNQILSKIEEYKAVTDVHYRSPQVRGQHDKDIPEKILAVVKSQLYANGINPSGITITIKNQSFLEKFFEKITLAAAFSPVIGYVQNKLQVITPPKIELNVIELQKINADNLLFRISHEVQHLIDHHATEIHIIESYTTSKNFKNDKVYKEYRMIIEKCADLLPSIYDKTIAQASYNVFWRDCIFNLEKHLPFNSYYSAPETQKIAAQHILACH